MKKPLHIVVFTAIAGVMPLLAFAQTSMKSSDTGGGGMSNGSGKPAPDTSCLELNAALSRFSLGGSEVVNDKSSNARLASSQAAQTGGQQAGSLSGLTARASGVWKITKPREFESTDPSKVKTESTVQYCVRVGIANASGQPSFAPLKVELRDIRPFEHDNKNKPVDPHVKINTESAVFTTPVPSLGRVSATQIWCQTLPWNKRPQLWVVLSGGNSDLARCEVNFGPAQSPGASLEQILRGRTVIDLGAVVASPAMVAAVRPTQAGASAPLTASSGAVKANPAKPN